eukprot:CAMPEP_0116579458 /NCGR_PEP_ID=MMETSP0397-20121206/22260_1 /TAXON_ID=216820 /ORGANISM="Cyclophora tenuis, Strain ECT3854" /LENGTH=157 /DNA_ID=CAMNT_0004108935 /DNA_START=296 /DNA_END=769 /DNA_ORIENTATION=-
MDANLNEQDGRGEAEENPALGIMPWQGENGVVANFAGIFVAVMFEWDWDRIDPALMLHDCLGAVLRETSKTLALPCLLCAAVLFLCRTFNISHVGGVSAGWLNMIVVRTVLVCVAVLRYLMTYKEQFRSWYDVAHKAARDDRYLIGETLLNYSPQEG